MKAVVLLFFYVAILVLLQRPGEDSMDIEREDRERFGIGPWTPICFPVLADRKLIFTSRISWYP
jgi:hypothetical protein